MNDIKIASLADIEALEQQDINTLAPYSSTYDLLRKAADEHQDKCALRFLLGGSADEEAFSYTYRELFASVTKTANALHALGVGPNDAVSSLLPNLPQTHFTIWGAEAAGIFNPLNPLLEIEHLAAIMNEAGTKVLVSLAPFPDTELWDKAKQLQPLVPSLTHILAIDLCGFLPEELASAIGKQREDYLGDSVLDFDALIAQHNGESLNSGREIKPEDIASYFHTGGTTGTPKLAPHTHHNEIVSCWQMTPGIGQNPNAVALCGLPLFHVNAVFVTGLAAWQSGAEVLLPSPQGYRNPAVIGNFWALVQKYGVTYFSAVPTILSGLLTVPHEDFDLSTLEFCVCGAAPLATDLFKRFEETTGLVILEGYGQTEGTCASSINPRYGERRVGSVGVRLPHMQLRTVIVDDDGRAVRDCEVDEVGVIAIKGGNVFAGYKKPEQNEGQWVDEGWFNTGDLGRLDGDGYLWLTGRSKDLIIRGGHNIDPQIIEEVLYTHPAVAEAAAIGQPDKRVGEIPVAYVQLQEGSSCDADTLQQFAQEHISERAAVPKQIIIIDQIPVTAVGKIFKPDLRCDIAERTARAALEEALGHTDFSVEASISKKHGQLVSVSLQQAQANSEAVRTALGDFAFKLELNEG
jgi:fatty-acyl-CoA synthase